jgi:hypothetical protein
MAPVGFFGSVGILKTGDETGFRNHGVAGINHGRVARMGELDGVA